MLESEVVGVLAAGAIALTLALPPSAFGIGPQLRGCRLTAPLARFLSASPSIARIRELCFGSNNNATAKYESIARGRYRLFAARSPD